MLMMLVSYKRALVLVAHKKNKKRNITVLECWALGRASNLRNYAKSDWNLVQFSSLSVTHSNTESRYDMMTK